MNSPLLISQKILLVLAIIVGVAFAGFMGSLMFRMVSLMQEMTGHIAEISTNMSSMSNVIYGMGEDVHLMKDEMTDISLRINVMDGHMFLMNRSISSIQTRLANNMGIMTKDMNMMVGDINNLANSIGILSADVHNMNILMYHMGHDINRVSGSYTSPPKFLRNMMTAP